MEETCLYHQETWPTHTFAGEQLDFSGTLVVWVSMTHIFKGGFTSFQEYDGVHIGMISRQDKDETTTQMCLNLSTTQNTNERNECISFLRIFPTVLTNSPCNLSMSRCPNAPRLRDMPNWRSTH